MRLERTLLLARNLTAFLPACCATAVCSSASAEEDAGPGLSGTIGNTIADITQHGDFDFYITGYAYHSRSQYSESRLKRLNEKTWGAGIGKTVRNERGNDESLFLIALRDSRRHMQWAAGYSYQWIYGLGPLEIGAGLAGGLTRRANVYHGVPFPVVLPVFSAGTQGVKVMGTYVPRVRQRGGEVALVFLKFEL
jgi:palmitoyl transferase